MRLGQDTKLILNTDGSVLYLAPGGLEGLYQPSDGSNYTTPAGFKNTLVKTGTTGWTLTEPHIATPRAAAPAQSRIADPPWSTCRGHRLPTCLMRLALAREICAASGRRKRTMDLNPARSQRRLGGPQQPPPGQAHGYGVPGPDLSPMATLGALPPTFSKDHSSVIRLSISSYYLNSVGRKWLRCPTSPVRCGP
jgi:hypothetical protein